MQKGSKAGYKKKKKNNKKGGAHTTHDKRRESNKIKIIVFVFLEKKIDCDKVKLLMGNTQHSVFVYIAVYIIVKTIYLFFIRFPRVNSIHSYNNCAYRNVHRSNRIVNLKKKCLPPKKSKSSDPWSS